MIQLLDFSVTQASKYSLMFKPIYVQFSTTYMWNHTDIYKYLDILRKYTFFILEDPLTDALGLAAVKSVCLSNVATATNEHLGLVPATLHKVRGSSSITLEQL